MSQDTDDDLSHLRKKPARGTRGTSNGNGGGWKKRQIETLTCPSGEIVQVQRPGPEFTLRAGRVVRTFATVLTRGDVSKDDGLSAHERGLKVIEGLSDEEFGAVMVFARELVCTMLVSPRLVMNPSGPGEIGPNDIGDDFWFLFSYAMSGFFGLTVAVGDGEVEVADLKTFRSEPGLSGNSTDRADVRTDAEQPTGDQGLVAGS